ncbi:MAG: primosomal protein N' [Anaerolineae bacterium]|nr:primosomal protein N' [Anaerolineae bacterium]MDW8172659.1 primosomal protein N' [Anaerolineae bacterium]
MNYAAVALNIPLNRSFDYAIPPHLTEAIQLGSLVLVPFGPSTQLGLVLETRPHTALQQTKAILELRDPKPMLTPIQLALGRWLSEAYLTPIGQALWTFLPPQLGVKRNAIQARMGRYAHLLLSAQDLEDGRWGKKQRRILEYLHACGGHAAAASVYEACNAALADLQRLEALGALTLDEREVIRDPLADKHYVPSREHRLNEAQAQALDAIRAALDAGGGTTFLLHGITGSGKTEVYLQAIAYVLAQERQALLLVPEIALTPQTVQRVASRFPQRVAVVHSGLSVGQRYDAWRRARDGVVRVVVGTRSALFTPLPQLGLIVIDEEHDHSYKHSPPFNPPYYHARVVAEQMARLAQAVLILGSATPSLEAMRRAEAGHFIRLSLPQRVFTRRPQDAPDSSASLPPVQVIDMRDELKAGNTSMFSRALHDALSETLARREQAIFFLNRRGQATYVFCRDCGKASFCPHCELPLTYHRQGEKLLCHICNYSQDPPNTCPSCQSARIRYFGAGTQQVEEELLRHFPQARLVRWDADTVHKADDHEAVLRRFLHHEADILVGTQMVAKGLDLPLVTLVGIVSADHALNLPDFRASERSFQTLTQVSGRAGRAALGGRVIMQTYQPSHPAIVYAAQHDYLGFYQAESQARRDLGYPPFRRLARLLIQHSHPTAAQREAEALAQALEPLLAQHRARRIGPAPCYHSKLENLYRWHVLVLCADPVALLRDSAPALSKAKHTTADIDPIDLL